MKKIYLTIAFIFIVSISYAAFSGYHFCYRRGGVTYKHRLYTSSTDINGIPQLVVYYNGTKLYGGFSIFSPFPTYHPLYFRAKIGSGKYSLLQQAFKYTTTVVDTAIFARKIAIDSSGNIYVAEGDASYRVCIIKKYNSSGTYLTQWGSYGTGNSQFINIEDIHIDSSNNVWVVDSDGYKVKKYNSSGSYLLSLGTGTYGSGDGVLDSPVGVTTDSSGNIYVTELNNSRVQKFNSSGTYVTKWGSFGSGASQFNNIDNIVCDSSNNIYVADYGNNRIQKFNSSGTYITSFAVNGPSTLTINSYDELFVVTTDSSYKWRIINTSGQQCFGSSDSTIMTDMYVNKTNNDLFVIRTGLIKKYN